MASTVEAINNDIDNGRNNATSKEKVDNQKYTNAIALALSAFAFVFTVIQVFNNQEDDRLNVLNPMKSGREYSKLSATVFALLPLLGAKTLYHLYRQTELGKNDDSGTSIIVIEPPQGKGARQFLTLAILVLSAVAAGLVNHDSPDYCLADKYGIKADAKDNGLDLTQADQSKRVVNVHTHVNRCLVKDLVHGDVKYGEAIIANVIVVFGCAVALRIIGAFLDHPDYRKTIHWGKVGDIPSIKYMILVASSATAVIASTIGREEDLNEKISGTEIEILTDEDLAFFTWNLVFTWLHTVLLTLGLMIKLSKDGGCLKRYEFALLNNVPLVRIIVTTGALSAIAYLMGMSAVHSVDYSFLSIALVGEITLDLFGRDKVEAQA